MKKIIVLLLAGCSFIAQAQHASMDCSSKEETERLKAILLANREILIRSGKLKTGDAQRIQTYNAAFEWPVIAAGNYYQPGFYYISKYVDLDFSVHGDTSSTEDYSCGHRSYDTPATGYNHDGIDIALGPYGWTMFDNNNAYAVAALGGTIVDKHDGEFSRTCFQGVSATSSGNYLAIEHTNGMITYYKHLKMGTLTAKEIGDDVRIGEYLGVVGSSGNSTGPHLHFQIMRSATNSFRLDPFQNGPCREDLGGQIPSSLWADEEPYENRKIISVFTTSGPITPSSCDTTGVSHGYSGVVPYRNHFAPSSFIFFQAVVRDISTPYTVRLRVLTPSNAEIYDQTFYVTKFDDLYSTPLQTLLVGSEQGVYRLQCTYSGQNYYHFFTVGCQGSQTLSGTRNSHTAAISGGSINSTETVPNDTYNSEYQAETYIQFNPGFVATSGCEFRARIDDCTVGGQRMATAEQKQTGKEK